MSTWKHFEIGNWNSCFEKCFLLILSNTIFRIAFRHLEFKRTE